MAQAVNENSIDNVAMLCDPRRTSECAPAQAISTLHATSFFGVVVLH